MGKKLAKNQSLILRYEELEQRVLFSADIMPGLDSLGFEEQGLVEEKVGAVRPEQEIVPSMVEQAAAQAHSELVIVSPNVPDYQQLTADLQGSDNSRIVEVAVLEADRDGIEQVSEILADRSDLAAVHFITHGTDAQINLGGSWLNATTLQQNSDAVAAWGNALTDEGDMLFYGCNIAGGADGQYLLNNISKITGADVTASEDVTGHEDLGGDWELEFKYGAIETAVAINEDTRDNWNATLAPPVITSNGGGGTALINVLEDTTAVTTVTASDPDVGDSLTYSISGGTDAAKFNINTTSGALTFIAAPDFQIPTDANTDNVYEVTVQADDGNGGTDTQALSVAVNEAWWDTNWLNRTKITFDNSDQTTYDLVNFPVLVTLNTTDLPNLDLSTTVGADVRFTDAVTGDELKYEVEAWDDVADTATVWVKVPQIDKASDTDYIWVYYN